MLQGALVTAMQGVAPQAQILSKIQTSGPVFTISKLSNQSTITDMRNKHNFWTTIRTNFSKTLLALTVAEIQSPF